VLLAGSKTSGESANAMVKEIIHWHEVPRLETEVEKAVKGDCHRQ